MGKEVISVIIPCYNYGHLIAETLDSVLNQTHTDFEIIVIDDGSTDNTGEVLKTYIAKDERVRYYKYSNTGLGATRNRGIEYAQGDYIQFLDADDLIEPRKFEIQLQLFKSQPEADIVYGSVRYFTKNAFDESDRLLTYWGPDEEWMPKISGWGLDILPRALKGNFSHLSSPLFKRQIVDKVGVFDNDISAVADYHFLLRCAIANAYFYYHDAADSYSLVRWHKINMSSNVAMMRTEEQKMRLILSPMLANYPEAAENNTNAIKAITLMLGTSWKRHLLSGGKLDAVKKVIRTVGLEKVFIKLFYK